MFLQHRTTQANLSWGALLVFISTRSTRKHWKIAQKRSKTNTRQNYYNYDLAQRLIIKESKLAYLQCVPYQHTFLLCIYLRVLLFTQENNYGYMQYARWFSKTAHLLLWVTCDSYPIRGKTLCAITCNSTGSSFTCTCILCTCKHLGFWGFRRETVEPALLTCTWCSDNTLLGIFNQLLNFVTVRINSSI